MSETNKTPNIFSDPFRAELEEIVEKAIKKALNGNGHHEGDRLLDAEQAATRCHVPKSHILDMARRGELPCVHLGHYVRFDPTELGQFIKDHGSHLPSQRNTPGKKSS